MKRKRRKLILMLVMLASFTMLFGCIKKNSENTTATVETPTPTPTEMPEATPTPTETPEPTATPEETKTVVSAVEVEEDDNREYRENNTSSPSIDSGSDGNDDNENGNHSDNSGNNDGNLNFAEDYRPREELSDEEVGYGSDEVPDASEPVAPGEGNQAKIAAAVYVRSGPGTDHEIIGSLAEGDIVVVLGNESGWLKINYGDKVGYFYQEFVALDW